MNTFDAISAHFPRSEGRSRTRYDAVQSPDRALAPPNVGRHAPDSESDSAPIPIPTPPLKKFRRKIRFSNRIAYLCRQNRQWYLP